MDQQQAFGGAGHGDVEQRCFMRFVFAGFGQLAQVGNDHHRKLQPLAGVHGDQLHAILDDKERALVLALGGAPGNVGAGQCFAQLVALPAVAIEHRDVVEAAAMGLFVADVLQE